MESIKTMAPPENATVYLIHFQHPFWHAQHYLGYTANLPRRIEQHRNGTGAKLLRAVTKRGISWNVVRTWSGGPALERALKNRKKSRDLCPVCIQCELSRRWQLKQLDLRPAAQLWEV